MYFKSPGVEQVDNKIVISLWNNKEASRVNGVVALQIIFLELLILLNEPNFQEFAAPQMTD